jgi:hypothetical protein
MEVNDFVCGFIDNIVSRRIRSIIVSYAIM